MSDDNTTRIMKVEKCLGQWAVVAYTGSGHPNDGTVWLRGFETEENAKQIAQRLQDAMKQEVTK